jgi:arylsulfatase A-like enzyme
LVSRVHIRSGATYGAALWLAYGVVETWMLGILPWLSHPVYLYRPLHSGLTALLFGIYPLLGAATGATAALLIVDELALRASLIVVFALAYAANALILLPSAAEFMMPLAGSAIGAAAAVIAVRVRRLRPALEPWCTVLLIAGPPWITKYLVALSPRPIKLGIALAWWLVVLAVAVAVAAARRGHPGRMQVARPWRLAIATFVATLLMRSGPKIDGSPSAAVNASGRSGPSVVLITMDTVRADHLSLYGYEKDTSPSLNALARRATLYRHAESASDVTPASHGSLVTGLYPSQHGARLDRSQGLSLPLDPDVPTLAAQLASSGYHTLGVVANHGYLGHAYGFDRGFHYYDQRVPVRLLLDEPDRNHFLRQGAERLLQRLRPTDLAGVDYRRADEINGVVLPLFHQLKTEARPFFLFVNYMDAHWPYRPPRPFDTKFGGTSARSISAADYSALWADVNAARRTLTGAERAALESQYDGGIANVDRHIGALVDQLEQLDLFDDCLFIVTSDHGEAFGERGLLEHGVSVYGDLIHVPLLVKYPRQRTPRIVGDVVSGVDVMATILDVTGHAIPGEIEGRSLAAEPDPSAPPRVVFSESFPDASTYGLSPRFHRIERAVFADGVKLITSTAGKRELYDVEDIEDAQDLAALRPEVAQRLDQRVSQWLASIKPLNRVVRPLDPMTLQRLKSLGYLR